MLQHGTASAIKHFAPKYPALKWSMVNEWKKEIIKTTKLYLLENNGQIISIDELEKKKRGRPATLSEDLSKDLRLYIRSIREGGGAVNTAIMIAAGTRISTASTTFVIRMQWWSHFFEEKLG